MIRQMEVSCGELSALRRKILTQMEEGSGRMAELFSTDSALPALKKLRFEKTAADPLFDERMNFSEYLNQAFTYLVCLYADGEILRRFSLGAVVINFGVQPGYDVASPDGGIICECFAATSVKSNEKLKKDILRVHQNKEARKKLVYFYSDSAEAEQAYIQSLGKQFSDVSINSVSFEQLTAI